MHGRMEGGRGRASRRDADACASDAARAYPAHSLRSCAPLSLRERGRGESLRRRGQYTCPFRSTKGARVQRAGYAWGWRVGAGERVGETRMRVRGRRTGIPRTLASLVRAPFRCAKGARGEFLHGRGSKFAPFARRKGRECNERGMHGRMEGGRGRASRRDAGACARTTHAHTPLTRFACARPFRWAKGARVSCSCAAPRGSNRGHLRYWSLHRCSRIGSPCNRRGLADQFAADHAPAVHRVARRRVRRLAWREGRRNQQSHCRSRIGGRNGIRPTFSFSDVAKGCVRHPSDYFAYCERNV